MNSGSSTTSIQSQRRARWDLNNRLGALENSTSSAFGDQYDHGTRFSVIDGRRDRNRFGKRGDVVGRLQRRINPAAPGWPTPVELLRQLEIQRFPVGVED